MGNFPLHQNKLWQNCPFSFWNIDSRKAGRGKGSKKEMGDPERERKHLVDGKETAIDSTPEHFSILQIMTSHPVRQRAIQKIVRVGGYEETGRKRTIYRGGNWSRNCYFAGYNIPANDVCAVVCPHHIVVNVISVVCSAVALLS